jgi:hypothetical protein
MIQAVRYNTALLVCSEINSGTKNHLSGGRTATQSQQKPSICFADVKLGEKWSVNPENMPTFNDDDDNNIEFDSTAYIQRNVMEDRCIHPQSSSPELLDRLR